MGKVQISGGFLLLVAWFALVNGWRLLVVILSAATLHELGHCVVLWSWGAEIRRLQIGVCGAVLETDAGQLSYGQELAAILAGPGTNFLCAVFLLQIPAPWATVAAGAHLVLCGFNLLPMRPLDGGRALWLCLTWLLGPDVGDLTAAILGGLTGLLCGGGLLLLVWHSRGSLWLLPAAAGLLVAGGQELWKAQNFL